MTQIKLCKNNGQTQVAVTIPAPVGNALKKIHRDVLCEIPRCAQDDYAMESLHGGMSRFSINIANPQSKTEIMMMATALYTALKSHVQDLIIDATLNVPEEVLT